MTIDSSYTPGRSLVQTMPGAAPAGDLSAGLLALLRARKALAAAPQSVSGGVGATMPMSAQRPAYTPSFGASGSGGGGGGAKPKEITRVVSDPFASPYTKMATGFDPGSRVERYIPGVGWEFEDLRPHGSSGGIQGGGMSNPSSLHSTSSEGGPGPVNPPDANKDNFDTKTGMLSPRRDTEPLTGMQRQRMPARNPAANWLYGGSK